MNKSYLKGFIPYAICAFTIGLVGGFTSVLGPAFVSDIEIPYNNTTWTALATAVTTATCAPILGKLGDILGRRLALLIGIFIFIVGNILTATADSLLSMILARLVVGAGTAASAPIVIAYIVTEFPPDRVAKGFALYMLISSSAVIFGPTLGSLIILHNSWQVMMWICVILALSAFVLCWLLLDKTASMAPKTINFDAVGALLSIIFFSLLLCIPSFGQNIGWTSVPFIASLLLALAVLPLLIAVERKNQNPLISPHFVKRKAFILPVLILFLTQGLMQANMTNIIVFVNYTQESNYVISGYAISIMYLGMSLGSIILGPMADKKEPKRVLLFSLLLTGIGCGILLLFSTKTALITLASSLGILGLGLGGNATLLMRVALSDVPSKDAGTGTGTYGLFRDLTSPFGVAVFVPLFTNSITANIALGQLPAAAAVASIKTLAAAELVCISVAIVLSALLPRIHSQNK